VNMPMVQREFWRYTRAMKFSQLKVLVAVVRGGSFSEASLELNQSQSSVSEAIASLETELGVRLLERGRFGARPTAVGEKVLERAREVLGSIEGIEQEVALERGQVSGVLRVVSFRSAASQIVAPLLSILKQRFPLVQLQLEETSSFQSRLSDRQLQEGSSDLSFGTALNSAFMGWELICDPFYALFPLEGEVLPAEVTIDFLRGRLLVLPSEIDCGVSIEKHFKELELSLEGVQRVRDDSTLIQMAAKGVGVGILPRLAVEHADYVRKVPLSPPLERHIYLQVRHGALRLPSVRVFLHLLAEFFPESGLPLWTEESGIARV